MAVSVCHDGAVMTPCYNILIDLRNPLKCYAVIGFIVQNTAVLLKPSVCRYGNELLTLLDICHIPGIRIPVLILGTFPGIVPDAGISLEFKLRRPLRIRYVGGPDLCYPYPVRNTRIRILGAVYINRIINHDKARFAAAPSYLYTVKIDDGDRSSSPARAVPFFIRSVGILGAGKKYAVAYTLGPPVYRGSIT